MKLKYYLRGIGIGILVTTFIFICAIAAKGGLITDEKAVARAKQLGYTLEASGNASSILMNSNTSVSSSGNSTSADAVKQQIEANANSIKENAASTADNDQSSDDESNQEESTTTNNSDTQAEDQQSSTDGNDTSNEDATTDSNTSTTDSDDSDIDSDLESNTKHKVKLVISKSMGSEEVSNRLYELGAVDDADDFNDYLIDNGYSKKIQSGDFTIQGDSTYKEIAKKITGN